MHFDTCSPPVFNLRQRRYLRLITSNPDNYDNQNFHQKVGSSQQKYETQLDDLTGQGQKENLSFSFDFLETYHPYQVDFRLV